MKISPSQNVNQSSQASSTTSTKIYTHVQHQVNGPIRNETSCMCNTFQAPILHTYTSFFIYFCKTQNAPAKLLHAPQQALFCMSSIKVIHYNHILCLQGNNYFHILGKIPGFSTLLKKLHQAQVKEASCFPWQDRKEPNPQHTACISKHSCAASAALDPSVLTQSCVWLPKTLQRPSVAWPTDFQNGSSLTCSHFSRELQVQVDSNTSNSPAINLIFSTLYWFWSLSI